MGEGSVFRPCFVVQFFVSFYFAIILMMKRERELIASLKLSSWCFVTVSVLWLFLTVLWISLQCVIMVLPVHTHLPVGCSTYLVVLLFINGHRRDKTCLRGF